MKVGVVGAGLGGLSAAIEAAADGHQVEVYEMGDRAGGKAGMVEVEGVCCDTGPSLLTLPDVFDHAFRRAGSRLEDEVELRTLRPSFLYRFPEGHEIRFQPSIEETAEELRGTLGPKAADEFRGFLNYARDIWEASAPHFVYGDAPSMGTILKLGVSKVAEVRKIDSMRTMWSAIESRVSHRDLQWIFARYATYNGSNVFRAPATLNCICWVEMGIGGFGVTGGIHALVDRLVARAEQLGVSFHFSQRVDRIVTRWGKVKGLDVGGREVPLDAVVVNGDVRGLPKLLDPNKRPKSGDDEGSMSAWNALVRGRRQPDRPPHAVLFPRDYTEEFRDIFERRRPPLDPTIYVCAKGPAHGSPGWEEDEPLFLMANAPATTAPMTPDMFDRIESDALDRLRRVGWIAPEDRVLWRRVPSDLAARFPDSHGSIYGAASNSSFSAFKRPGNRHGSVKRLYLASGTAHPGGGMPLSVLSGRAAARALREDS